MAVAVKEVGLRAKVRLGERHALLERRTDASEENEGVGRRMQVSDEQSGASWASMKGVCGRSMQEGKVGRSEGEGGV